MALDRTFDAADVDTAGIGVRAQAAVARRLNFQTHGDAPEQGSAAHHHPDGVAVLFDGRMRFQFTDAALCVTAGEPIVPGLENRMNADRTGGTGSDAYAARIGSQVEIYEPGHAQGPIERTFRPLGVTEAHGDCEECEQSHGVYLLDVTYDFPFRPVP